MICQPFFFFFPLCRTKNGLSSKTEPKIEKREGKKSIKDNTFRKGRRSLFLLYRLSRERTEGFEARDLSERGWSELLREGKGRRRRRIGSRARRLRFFPLIEKNFTTSTSTSVRPRNSPEGTKASSSPGTSPPFFALFPHPTPCPGSSWARSSPSRARSSPSSCTSRRQRR